MNNRLKIFDNNNGYLDKLYDYNKNNLLGNLGSLKKYASKCDLSNSSYISEVIDDGDRFILRFTNPVSPKYLYAHRFTIVDEYGNTNFLKIRDEYLDKLSIEPIYGIYFIKEDNIKFAFDTNHNHVLGTDLKRYNMSCHPNISSWFCLGGLERLFNYTGSDYIEYLINNLLLRPSYINPFGDNKKLYIDNYLLDFENQSNISEEIIKKYFEKPDIITL